MIVVLIVILAAFLASPGHDEYQAAGAQRGVFLAVLYATLFLAGYFVAETDRWAIGIVKVIVVMTVFQAILTIIEWREGAAVVIRWPIWQMMGLVSAAVTRGDQFRPSGLFRPQGTAAHPIVASALAALAILIIISMLIEEGRPRLKRWLLAASLPILLSVFLVNTRTGFVILVVGVLTIVAVRARWLPRLLPLAIVGAVGIGIAAALSPGSLRSSLDLFWRAGEDSSVTVRLDRLGSVPELIAENPIFGPGWFTTDPHVLLFDNTWILSLVEFGVVGTAAIVVFMLSTMGRMWTVRHIARGTESILIMCGMAAGAGLFVSGFTFDVFAFAQFLPIVILMMGMGLAGADRAVRRSIDDEIDPTTLLEAQTGGAS
jgi:O-antigen ligase